MKIFLTFIFVVAIATLGVMNWNIQAADEQKAEAVASTVEHPKGEHPKAEYPKSEKETE